MRKEFSYTPEICNLPAGHESPLFTPSYAGRSASALLGFLAYARAAVRPCGPLGADRTCSPPRTRMKTTRATPRQATSAVAYVAPPPEEDDPLLSFAPYLHPQPRANSITPERQRRFVATLAATGIVSQAARSIGKSMEALYKLRHRPGAEGFASAWDAALERGMQRLEDCALERALKGTPTPIVSGGEILGWWDKPDNALLRFLLQYRLPTRYGVQDIRPGHPVYESIKAEVLAEDAAKRAYDEDEVIDSLCAKLEAMAERQRIAKAEGWLEDDGSPGADY
jgi:hypothetical protein